jgi:putative phosphoribosyl transferase
MTLYRDRIDAGRQLGNRLGQLRGRDVVVLGLARGGVPVAWPNHSVGRSTSS